MGSLESRLQRLEGQTEKAPSGWKIPIEVRLLTKAAARAIARKDGREPPSYTQEEIEEMRRDDLESVDGEGVVAQLRESRSWQSEESQELLDLWVDEARRRLEAARDLPPERWQEVWGVDEEDDYEGEEE